MANKVYISVTAPAYDEISKTLVDTLGSVRKRLAATHVGDYALFSGGLNKQTILGTVDAYSSSLVKTTVYNYDNRYMLAATHVGDYALFGGGSLNVNSGYSTASVLAYDTSLTKTSATSLSLKRMLLAATHVGDYALFGGGSYQGRKYSSGQWVVESNSVNNVDAYDTSLTRTTPTNVLSTNRYKLAATHVGNYALFGGGYIASNVDVYDTSLTRTTPTAMTYIKYDYAATYVGNYALFGGGDGQSSAAKPFLDIYDSSLTHSSGSVTSYLGAAANLGDYALFGGGCNTSGNPIDTVTVINTSLTKETSVKLTSAREELAATHVGDYALFSGGEGISSSSAITTDAYRFNTIYPPPVAKRII